MVARSRTDIGGNSAAAWEALREEAMRCTRCHLYKCATQTVFGEGGVSARLMLVGEQPGDQEDLAGKPFVGPAGQVLDRALEEAGVDRSTTYVTNAVKHFKFEQRGKRRIHSKPNGPEIDACRWWIDQERALIRPPVDLPEHRMLMLDAESWVACLPRDHRFAERASVEISELLDDPIVCAPLTAGRWRDYWLAMDARGSRPPTIAAVAATYEAETTAIARGLGISFTTSSVARFYDRPGIVYVPIRDRPPSHVALAWHPASLTPQADALIRHVRQQWNFGADDEVAVPATQY